MDGTPTSDQSFNPVIIQSNTSYLSVNKTRLKLNQRTILQNGDIIKRTDKRTWMFNDFRTSNPDINEPALRQRYFLEKNLTLGRDGDRPQVYLAHDVQTLEKFAIKAGFNDARGSNEVSAMRKLKHPNLMELLEVIKDDQKCYLIMELMDGDLFSALDDVNDISKCKFLMHQISSGLQFLHKQGLAHLDVKVDNIFWKKKNGETIYKLGDFEFCCADQNSIWAGTEEYFSPELLDLEEGRCKSFSGIQSDMWSLGVTIYAAFTGSFPFVKNKFSKIGVAFDDDSWKCYPQLENLLKKLLVVDPKERISSSVILLDPFFDDEQLRERIKRTEIVFGPKKDLSEKKTPKRRQTVNDASTESRPVRRSARFMFDADGKRKSVRIQEAELKKMPIPRRKSIYYESRVEKRARRKTFLM